MPPKPTKRTRPLPPLAGTDMPLVANFKIINDQTAGALSDVAVAILALGQALWDAQLPKDQPQPPQS